MKIILGIITAFILAVVFFTPARSYMNSLLHKDEGGLITEGQIIGITSGRNPRAREIQQILKEIGLDPGEADGLMGSRTRNAIKEFQKTRGLKPTGSIDSLTMSELNKAKEEGGHITGSGDGKIIQPVQLAAAQSRPSGQPAIVTIEPKKITEAQDEVLSYRLRSQSRTKQIQEALQRAGFYSGDIDGKSGSKTNTAIKAFQRSKGLVVDGIVGHRTWDALSKYLTD